MNIKVSSSSVSTEITNVNNSKKLLIAGPALSNYKAREIVLPADKEEALNLFGQSELYEAYVLLKDMGINNIYLANCYNRSDYVRLVDKILHYDFDYFIPINLYLSDTFYNPLTDTNQYYAHYFLEQFASVKSLTTIMMTERHAELYEDFDHYASEMNRIETEFVELINYNSTLFFETNGNNLNFVYNNLSGVPYSNVVLGALFVNRDYAKYLPSISGVSTVYDIDNNDIYNLRAMYYKFNYYTREVTLENPMNFRETSDIYANALIDDVIKRVIKSLNLDKFKGRLYNQYISIQVDSEVKRVLNSMRGQLFKEYTINNIGFKKTAPTSGYIYVDYSFIPYGTLESLNVIMGV